MGAFALAFRTDELHERSLPGPDFCCHRVREAGTGAGKIVRAQQLAACGVRAPALVGVLGRVGGFVHDDRLQPRFNGCFHLDSGSGLAAEEGAHPVPHATDVLFQDAEELAGTDKVLPAGQNFAAQEGTVPRCVQNPGPGILIGVADIPGEDVPRLLLLPGCLRKGGNAAAERAYSAIECPAGNLSPSGRICCQFMQPMTQRFHGAAGQHSEAVQGHLRNNKQRGCTQALPLEHGPEVRTDLLLGGRGHAVQHHGHHDVP
ncbi:hypothetical protein D9M72_464280 [compost metagenome]